MNKLTWSASATWQAAALLAIVLAALLLPGAAQNIAAQNEGKTITGLSAASTTPGTMSITWDQPTDVPSDYRVSWARSDDDWKTWTNEDWNAFPTTNSYTVNGLDGGVEYKARVRARYSDSSGPWSDVVTVTVMTQPDEPEPQPPAKPQGLTGTFKHNQVSLSWDDPEDESISGYQVLRRDRSDEDSEFSVLAADTDSADSTYTDADVAAGESYAYRVRARNANGLSEASEDFNADLPQPPDVAVTFGQAAYNANEGAAATVSVVLNSLPTTALTIPLLSEYVGGASGGDVSGSLPSSVDFAIGETRKSLTFDVEADDESEDGEGVTFGFNSSTLPSGVIVGSPATTTVNFSDVLKRQVNTLRQAPVDPTISFELASYEVAESDDTTTTGTREDQVTIKVILSQTFTEPVTIPITKTHEGGAGDEDYSGVPDELMFNSGETEKSIVFTASPDDTVEGDERVLLGFGDLPAGVTAGSIPETTVSIVDDDAPYVDVRFVYETSSVTEGRTIEIPIELNRDPERILVIPLRKTRLNDLYENEYEGIPDSVTFNPGETRVTLDVSGVLDNTVDGETETVQVAFGELPHRVTSRFRRTAITIDDADIPRVVVEPTVAVIREGESSTYDVFLTKQPSADVTVTFSQLSEVTSVDRSSLTFTADNWSEEQTVTVTAKEDPFAEDSIEGFNHDVTSMDSNYHGILPESFKYRFVDNDTHVTFDKASRVVAEGDSVTVVVSFSRPLSETVTIPIRARTRGGASPSDYSVPTEVTFQSGQTRQTLDFRATQDIEDDDGERVEITLVNRPTGVYLSPVLGVAIPTVTFSIIDDDTGISFDSETYTVAEGDSVPLKLTLSAPPEEEVTVPITVTAEGRASNEDYSIVPSEVIFNVGETMKTLTLTAAQDTQDNDGKRVRLVIGDLPAPIVPGRITEAVVSITDDDDPGDRLRSLVVTPKDIDSFDTLVTGYMVGVAHDVVSATITATPLRSDAAVTIDGTAVTSGAAHPVTLSEGLNTFAVLVTSPDDGMPSTTYTVHIGRGSPGHGNWKGADDLDTLRAAGNTIPTGIWSDGATIWVIQGGQRALYAYTLAGGARNGARDFNLATNNGHPSDLWSNGATIWVLDWQDKRIYAYNLSDGTRLSGSDIDLDDGNDNAAGIWSDGATMWIGDWQDRKLFAYSLVGGNRDAEKDFSLANANRNPRGVWSNGDIFWVVDATDGVIYAYNLSGERLAEYDITLDPNHHTPLGIWGNDNTLWLSNRVRAASSPFNRVFSYNNVPVTVRFEHASYTVAESDDVLTTGVEEHKAEVKVILDTDPESTVVIPLNRANQGGATDQDDPNPDYLGVPASVTFGPGDTEKSFTFTAVHDIEDDDDENIKLTFGTLPAGVREADASVETVVNITDDDDPEVTVSFGQASYIVAESDETSTTGVEENKVKIKVLLNADPERTVIIPITRYGREEAVADPDENYTDEELAAFASNADYSGVPANLQFNIGETEKEIIFTAEHDTVDDDGESLTLGFGTLPARVSEGPTNETVVSIIDDDVPFVQVTFANTTDTVREGYNLGVKVVLDVDPERTVIIPLTATEHDGATHHDYTIPSAVTFRPGQTEAYPIFNAVQDNIDEDDERVALRFGTPLQHRVTVGNPDMTDITITDDDGDGSPIKVTFKPPSWAEVSEGEEVAVTIVLSKPANDDVRVPLRVEHRQGLTDDDYSLPGSVLVTRGETEAQVTFTSIEDELVENDEAAFIKFHNLPSIMQVGYDYFVHIQVKGDDENAQTLTTSCPPDSGERIILESVDEISQAGETDFLRVELEPYRVYIFEMLGADDGRDLLGVDSYSGDLTLADPDLIGLWNSDGTVRVSNYGSGVHDAGSGRNSLAVDRVTRAGPFYIEVASGDGGTGTYQIKVRVNNVCAGGNYYYFGGPDGYVLDDAADSTTDRTLNTNPGAAGHPQAQGGFLGDNWDWYWDNVPDEDWFKVELTQGYEYTVDLWTDASFPEEHQATQLKILGIYDGNGDLVDGTASPSSGRNVSVTFRPESSGTYYVSVGSEGTDRTGVFNIRVTAKLAD